MRSRRKGLDWAEASARVARAQLALERALTPDDQQLDTVYRKRSRELAGRGVRSDTRAILPVLVFALGTERYGFDLKALAEVLPATTFTPVPGVSAEVLGAINVRGEIRLVADLAALLELSLPTPADPEHVLMLRQPAIGLAVQQVLRLEQVPLDTLKPLPDGAEGSTRYVHGVTGDGLLILSPATLQAHPVLAGAHHPDRLDATR